MNIKSKISKLAICALASFTTVGCTGDFAELNSNPKALASVAPEELFYTAQMEMQNAGTYWMSSASKGRWLRYGTVFYFYAGTDTFSYINPGFGTSIYDAYNRMGGLVTNIGYLADNHATTAAYANLKAMCRIMLISKAIHTSDMWGSLAYSEAWQARNGATEEEKLEPKFETQKQLSDVWDAELKACIATLKSATNQKAIGGYDRAYNGKAEQWIKAANALRLRLATRLLKREPATAKAIAAEVLAAANAQYVMSSPDDSFILWFDNLYPNITGGDWHSPGDLLGAATSLMDYLVRNEDPRKRMFFRKNNLSPEYVELFNKWATETEEGQAYTQYDPSKEMADQKDYFKLRYIDEEKASEWMGGSSDPAKRSTDSQIVTRNWAGSGNPTGSTISMRGANWPQYRLFKGNHDNGSGGMWFPVMTHADFCFQAAEFVLAQGVTGAKGAQAYYEEGVDSSLDQWNALGKWCDIYDYSPMTKEEIDAFLAKPGIAWAGDAAKQLEQIRVQAWVDNFKNYDEGWAQLKRTDCPNTETTIATFEVPYYPAGVEQRMPRRAKFDSPAVGLQNYANLLERLETMKADPEFGELNDEFGRLWWDKK